MVSSVLGQMTWMVEILDKLSSPEYDRECIWLPNPECAFEVFFLDHWLFLYIMSDLYTQEYTRRMEVTLVIEKVKCRVY